MTQVSQSCQVSYIIEDAGGWTGLVMYINIIHSYSYRAVHVHVIYTTLVKYLAKMHVS